MLTDAVSAPDLSKHTINIRRRKVVPGCRANHFELLPHPGARFTPACQVESLADPLDDGHPAGARYALNFPVFGVFQNQLEPFGHG
jgi:hypothetical protein